MARERLGVVIVSVIAGFAACSVAHAQSGSPVAGGPALDAGLKYDWLAQGVDLGLDYSWGRQDTGEGGGNGDAEERMGSTGDGA